jgi:transcriptional regulator with XRE-family HTH domain
MTEYKKKIRRDLLSMKMSMRDLSLTIGVSQNMACKWFNGPYVPKFKHLVKLCKTIHGENWKDELIKYAELVLELEQ